MKSSFRNFRVIIGRVEQFCTVENLAKICSAAHQSAYHSLFKNTHGNLGIGSVVKSFMAVGNLAEPLEYATKTFGPTSFQGKKHQQVTPENIFPYLLPCYILIRFQSLCGLLTCLHDQCDYQAEQNTQWIRLNLKMKRRS